MEIKKGFKNTEVGVIPRDWEVKELGGIVNKFVNGGTPSTVKQEFWKGNIPWITGADILNQSVAVIRRYITLEAVKNSSTNVIEKGNILFVSRTGVGKLAIAPFDIAISQDFTGIFVNKDLADPLFLFRYFDYAQNNIKAQNQGTSIQGVTRDSLASFLIPLPPTLAEQSAIATALKDTDNLINQLEQLLAKKRAIKTGAMQELLASTSSAQGRPKKGWVVKKLGEVGDITKGQLITEKTAIPDGIPVIGGGMSISYYHNKSNRIGTTITISASGAYAGYISIHNYPIFASDCSTIKESEAYDIYFLYFNLLNRQKEVYSLQTGGAQPHVYPQQLRNLFVPIPKSKSEQTRIARTLSEMDAEIQALEKKLEKYKMIKQGMMQVLLTGKIRLVHPEKTVTLESPSAKNHV